MKLKIIATVGSSAVLIEVSKDDLARALGKYSAGSMESDDRQSFSNGREYDLNDRISYIQDVQELPSLVSQYKTLHDKMGKNIASLSKLGSETDFVLRKRKER